MTSVAESEGVDENDIIMFTNDQTIHPYDSLQSLGITVADIIGLLNYVFVIMFAACCVLVLAGI